jgi:phosphomannomutase
MKKLFIFDLDNTLSESRTRIDPDMAGLLCELLSRGQVAVISGATFTQFEDQLVRGLSCEGLFSHLSILATSGGELWVYRSGSWHRLYSALMSEDARATLIKAVVALADIPLGREKSFIDDRGTQVTYSALGLDADMEKKKAYDPDEKKRRDFVGKIAPRFPEFSFNIGGTTSIDITMKGIDKSFGIKKLLEHAKIAPSEAVFVGDALYEGGNDSAARKSGVEVIATSGPEETRSIIRGFLSQKI